LQLTPSQINSMGCNSLGKRINNSNAISAAFNPHETLARR
jgi:hypothetical protein